MIKQFQLAVIGILFIGLFSISMGQNSDSTKYLKDLSKPAPMVSKVYYGGEIGLSFGSYFAVAVKPLVGYNVTPKFSMGIKVGYEYVSDSRYDETLTSHNYGGSIFSRYRIIPQLYAHAEYALVSYEAWYQTWRGEFIKERKSVPLFYLGAGYLYRISPGVALNLQVLFDVLNHDDSPFDSGQPFTSIGVWVGF